MITVNHRPVAVLFDVIETLISLDPLRERLANIGQPAYLLDTWYTRTLRDGMALSLAGDFVPFPGVARSALQAVTHFTVEDKAIDHFLAGFDELPAHPDAAPAMRVLADEGIRLGCLTNGASSTTRLFLERSGLGSLVERVVTVEDAGTWKPPASVYLKAVDLMELTPDAVAMVAVHAWDCHGAKRAGLTTGWASRLERRWSNVFTPPDVSGRDLIEVARGLIELPPR